MMLYVRTGFFMGAIALLSACGGGDVAITPAQDPSDAQALEVAGLNGIWEGDYTDASGTVCTDVKGLIYNGSVHAISENCNAVFAGSLTIDTGVANIDFKLFDVDGASTGQSNFSGSYTLKSQINGSLSNGGRLNLNYDINYENDSSIALVAGDWSAQGLAVRVDAGGNIMGVDTDNCSYTGSISIIDSDYNLYNINISVDNFNNGSCPLTGSYAGVASFTLGANASLTVLAGNESSIFFAGLSRAVAN